MNDDSGRRHLAFMSCGFIGLKAWCGKLRAAIEAPRGSPAASGFVQALRASG
jgi:hypothetical protein